MTRSLFTAAMLILLGSVAQRISYKKGPIRHRRSHRQYAFMPSGQFDEPHAEFCRKVRDLRVGPKTEEAAAKAMRDMDRVGLRDAWDRVTKIPFSPFPLDPNCH